MSDTYQLYHIQRLTLPPPPHHDSVGYLALRTSSLEDFNPRIDSIAF